VPLIFAGPGVPVGVRRGGDPVSLADLLPTVLAKLNVPTPQNLDGHDLFAAAASGRDFVYAETYLPRDFYNWSELHALRSSETKFIHSPVQERYDLKQDPLETRNNAVQDDERVRQLTRIVTKLAHDAGTTGRAVPDPALAARLQSLGYVATGGPAMSADDRADVRPDVKTRIHLVGRIDEALALKRVARNDAAATLLRQILSEDPANYLAAHTLGDVLFDLTRNEEALAAYRLAMRGREAAYYHYRIALLHERMGDYRAAAREFGRVARLTPEAAKEILERANTLRARGFARDGRAYLEALASPLGPTSESPTAAATPEVLNALGVARGEAGDLTGAVEAFAQAARTAPADFDSHANLALTRARQGDADAALASLARALELKPNETRLINLAAELRFRRNELETARALLSRSLAIDPEQPRIVQALRDVERQLSGR
jgi:tetratricopeptide (TPR) repeat protein